MSVKFIDLFAGMGGFRLGFERACKKTNIRSECVFTAEIKNHALTVYNQNFGENNAKTDITSVSSDKIPEFDVLLGGFPCQAFSDAGRRRGFEDTRGTLFFDIARILRDKSPRAFILENVESLFRHDAGKTFEIILNTLRELGYFVSYETLNACDFSIPQNRKRAFIVGAKTDFISLDFTPKPSVRVKDVLDAVQAIVDDFSELTFKYVTPKELRGKTIRDYRLSEKNLRGWELGLKGEISGVQKDIMRFLIKGRRKYGEKVPVPLDEVFAQFGRVDQEIDDLVFKKYANKIIKDDQEFIAVKGGRLSYKFTSFLDDEGFAPTLTASDMDRVGVVSENFIRKLTKVEALRMFGYPDNWKLCDLPDKKIFDLLGNSLCVPIVEAISERVLETLS